MFTKRRTAALVALALVLSAGTACGCTGTL